MVGFNKLFNFRLIESPAEKKIVIILYKNKLQSSNEITNTYNTLLLGATILLCCKDLNRSLSKLVVGLVLRKLPVSSCPIWKSSSGSSYLVLDRTFGSRAFLAFNFSLFSCKICFLCSITSIFFFSIFSLYKSLTFFFSIFPFFNSSFNFLCSFCFRLCTSVFFFLLTGGFIDFKTPSSSSSSFFSFSVFSLSPSDKPSDDSFSQLSSFCSGVTYK